MALRPSYSCGTCQGSSRTSCSSCPTVVNIFAISAIAIGSLQGAIGLFRLLLLHAAEDRLQPVWMSFGRWLVAGLTFQLAADIVDTTLAPSWGDIGKLGAIAVIRTFLNYFLNRDLDAIVARGRR